MKSLLLFEPVDKLIFSATANRKSRATLKLRSISDHALAYKVFTTDIKRYCARPNVAVLDPGAEVDVEFIQQASNAIEGGTSKRRDKILVQVASLDKVLRGPSEGSFHGLILLRIYGTRFRQVSSPSLSSIQKPSSPTSPNQQWNPSCESNQLAKWFSQ